MPTLARMAEAWLQAAHVERALMFDPTDMAAAAHLVRQERTRYNEEHKVWALEYERRAQATLQAALQETT